MAENLISAATPGPATLGDGDGDPDDLDTPPAWTARAGRRNTREKFVAGLMGLKHAVRGDSSFFAHAYRGTLIALTAALLGVNPLGWCLLVFGACLVLLSELTHSAIDTLARAAGDPEDPPYAWPARSPPRASSSPRSPPAPSPSSC